MQCSCGATAELTSQVNKKCKAELRYYACEKCGTVSDGVLAVQGRDVCWDAPGDAVARRHFVHLTPESAQELHQTVTALQDALLDEAPAPEGDTHTQCSFAF